MPLVSHGDETVDLQQKLARVQSLLESSRRVHSTIRLDDVLAVAMEIAVKELEADGAFFSSAPGDLESSPASQYGELPPGWRLWPETSDPGYHSAPLPGERGEAIAHLVVYRPDPLSFEEVDF